MATGGRDDVGDLAGGHEEVYEWTCDQCEDGGKMTEATAYCRDCDETYCDPCLKIHRRFPAMKNHKVLDDSQKDKWGKNSGARGSGKACKDHDGQIISMYCGDHDVVCCPICAALDHRGCDDMAFIPKIAKGIANSEEFLKTQDDMSTTIADNHVILGEAKQGQEMLDGSRRSAVGAICETKRQVIEIFEKLEEKAVSDVDKMHANLKNESEFMITTCTDVGKELEMLSQQLKSDNTVVDAEAFVLMKLVQKKVLECQSVGQKLSDVMSMEKFKITFNANPALQNVREITTLGRVGKSPGKRLYSLCEEYKCSIDTSTETHYTTVCGMYQLPNGNILLSDQYNEALKLLSSKYMMIDRCGLPGAPSQICCTDQTDPTEVVVALIPGSLQFVSIGKTMMLTKRIKLNHQCNGLLYYSGKFYISDAAKRVYIYTISGKTMKLLKTVTKDLDGIAIFSVSEDMALKISDVKNATGTIFIADHKNGIVSIDLDGNYLQTVELSNVGTCFKAVPDNHGNIFVINQEGHLVQLGDSGKRVIGTIETNAKQFFLDTKTSVLYVWCWVRTHLDTQPQRLKIFKLKGV